jgi:hypothetical protein
LLCRNNYSGTAPQLAHALSQHPPHHGVSPQENAMQIIHPDIDTAVFYVITTFCAILMLAL